MWALKRGREAGGTAAGIAHADYTRNQLTPTTEPTPDEKAAEIINAVPSTSLFTKTGGLILGVGVTAAAISTEVYVGV